MQSLDGQELLQNTAITLKITEVGISGSSGCNLYGAKYTARSKDRIIIGEVAHTDMGCQTPAGVMQQEEGYLSALQKTTNYNVDGENLFMLDQLGNNLLQFRLLPKFKANPEGIKGTTWRLSYADGIKPNELGAFIIWFDESTFRGTTSCRAYDGTYQINKDGIHVFIMKMATTAPDCTHADQTSENVYTSLLGMIDQYNVSPNRLELYTIQNKKLIYESSVK